MQGRMVQIPERIRVPTQFRAASDVGNCRSRKSVSKAEPSITQLFAENTILLGKVIDGMLLMLVEPTRKARDNK